jgi:NADPH:quinone reductase-like Zn-dependent oxidoreductase
MKAVVFTEYGSPDVLRLEDVAKPTPKPGQVLVRVHATTVNYGDLMARKLGHLTSREFNMPALLLLPSRMAFGWSRPRINILGSELAGQVEAVGERVTTFKPGDKVFAYTGMGLGANAEYVCLPENGTIAQAPANLSYDEAATLPYGAVMAVSLLKRANLQPGQNVLINGASGGIGAMAVQLARYYGADVTGVCGAPRLEYVRSLGAGKVVDYARQDFSRNGETYDLIFDILGRSSYSHCAGSLKTGGIYLLASFKSRALFDMLRTSLAGRKHRVICAMAKEKAESLVFVKGLVEAGKVKAVIDKRFPLERTAEAHRYVELGQKQGQVVITVA